jgi:hypothetical protein
LLTDTAAAVLTSFALVPQPLDLLSQAMELTPDRLDLLLLVLPVLLAVVLSFSPFLYFVLKLLETLSQPVDFCP